MADAPDFQHNKLVVIRSDIPKGHGIIFYITKENLKITSIYLSIRHCIEAEWLNDRDQFLFPDEGWNTDLEFQNDCLAFALFHGQNRITSTDGTNNWIPFTEFEVNAQAKFESNFMTDFIKGKLKTETPSETTLFAEEKGISNPRNEPLQFSEEATAVFDAGRELWKYYHAQKDVNVNASLYDIREHFQGRNPQGRMNSKSDDATYTALISELRSKLSILAEKIQPKVYEYGFLKE